MEQMSATLSSQYRNYNSIRGDFEIGNPDSQV